MKKWLNNFVKKYASLLESDSLGDNEPKKASQERGAYEQNFIFTCEYNTAINRAEIYLDFLGGDALQKVLTSTIKADNDTSWFTDRNGYAELSEIRQGGSTNQLCDQFSIYCYSEEDLKRSRNLSDKDISTVRLISPDGSKSQLNGYFMPYTVVSILSKSNNFLPLVDAVRSAQLQNSERLNQPAEIIFSYNSSIVCKWDSSGYKKELPLDGIDFFYKASLV